MSLSPDLHSCLLVLFVEPSMETWTAFVFFLDHLAITHTLVASSLLSPFALTQETQMHVRVWGYLWLMSRVIVFPTPTQDLLWCLSYRSYWGELTWLSNWMKTCGTWRQQGGTCLQTRTVTCFSSRWVQDIRFLCPKWQQQVRKQPPSGIAYACSRTCIPLQGAPVWYGSSANKF